MVVTFKAFEAAHETYQQMIKDEALQDESDEYFYDVQTTYVAALTGSKKWLRDFLEDRGIKKAQEVIHNAKPVRPQAQDHAENIITRWRHR